MIVDFRQQLDCVPHCLELAILVRNCGSFEESVVDIVGDERSGKLAEVLLEAGGDSVDIQVVIGDVGIAAVTFKGVADLLDLGIGAGFAVDALDIHTCMSLVI